MSLEFKKYKIDDIGKVVSGGTPSTKKDEYWNGDVAWITPKDLSSHNDVYISEGGRNISIEGLNNSSAKIVPKNTVLMTSRAPIGYIAIANNDLSTNQGFKSLICDEKICHYKYFYYWLKQNMEYIINSSSGSTFKEISGRMFKSLEISLPSIKEQNIISSILWTFDKKISVLNKINKNLIELSTVIHNDFIQNIDENNVCYYKEMDEFGNIVMGQSPKGKSYNYENIGIPLINGAADYENGYLKAQKYTTDPKKTCCKNDLIFCIRATIGLLVVCDREYCLGRGVAAITNIDPIYKEYTFHLINSSIENFKRAATGSIISGISRKDIEDINVKIPSDDGIKHYHNIQKPIFDKLESNRVEIIKLTNLRDVLLPQLMSCEIDVSKINYDLYLEYASEWLGVFFLLIQLIFFITEI